MVELNEVQKFCDQRVCLDKITDFPGAWNGLQVENNGEVTKLGASVDAGLVPFRLAIEKKIDLLRKRSALISLVHIRSNNPITKRRRYMR